MGKAARWLKGLLGLKKEKSLAENSSIGGEDLEKKRWSFATSGRNSVGIPARGSYDDGQNNLAIAMAAAVAADAAVAAAQAAATVVRLTNQGKVAAFAYGREYLAAVKIQAVFRGHLARKALRALKGLVKLQARVRGFLVRKRTVAILNRLHALVRAQAVIRTQRTRRSSMDGDFNIPSKSSIERFKEFGINLSSSHDLSNHTLDENSKILEVDTCRPTRSRRTSSWLSEYNEDQCYPPLSSSPRSYAVTSDESIPNHHRVQSFDFEFISEDYKFGTVQGVQRVVCPNLPNYMASTRSFNAKQRSLSAPKNRPSLRKKITLNELMSSRNSYSGGRIQNSSLDGIFEL